MYNNYNSHKHCKCRDEQIKNVQMACKCKHETEDLYMDDECDSSSLGNKVLLPSEIEMLKWLFSFQEEEHSTEVWEEVQCNLEKSKKNVCPSKNLNKRNCCDKQPCEKIKAVGELYNFMKVMKSNDVKSCDHGHGDSGCKCNYESVEPTFILAQLSARLLEFEKKLKNLNCSKNDKCYVNGLIKNAQRLILIQFIQGPCANDLLDKTTRQIGLIDCLINHIEKECLNTVNKYDIEAKPCENRQEIMNKSQDLSKNKSNCIKKKEKAIQCGEKLNALNNECNKKYKATQYDNEMYEPCKTKQSINTCNQTENNVPCNKKNNSNRNNGSLSKLSRSTLTSNNEFKGISDHNQTKLKNKYCQTDISQIHNNNGVYEVTTMYITYNKQNFINKLNELPKLTNVEKNYLSSNIDIDRLVTNNNGSNKKTYMTKVDDFNVTAEAKAETNNDNLNLIINNELGNTYITEYSDKVQDETSNLKSDLFYYAGKIGTLFLNAKNYIIANQKNSSIRK